MWVLETEHEFSARTVCILNHWASLRIILKLAQFLIPKACHFVSLINSENCLCWGVLLAPFSTWLPGLPSSISTIYVVTHQYWSFRMFPVLKQWCCVWSSCPGTRDCYIRQYMHVCLRVVILVAILKGLFAFLFLWPLWGMGPFRFFKSSLKLILSPMVIGLCPSSV